MAPARYDYISLNLGNILNVYIAGTDTECLKPNYFSLDLIDLH